MDIEADVLISGGRVYDPAKGIDYTGDLVIREGRIASHIDGGTQARRVINAKGCWVLPGLIDVHTHCFPLGTSIGINPDLAGIPAGVTATIDAGSAGLANYRALLQLAESYDTRVRIALNVCAYGQIMPERYPENLDPLLWDVGLFERAFAENTENVIGLKIRISRGIVKELGMEPLTETVKLAQRLDTRVFVHSTDPPATMREVAQALRPGDVLSHMYHGEGETIIKDGKLQKGIEEARKRGVLFDVAQGRGNFSIAVASSAIAEGFLPDTISTDLNYDNWNSTFVHSLPMVMSKLRALGMSLEEVITAATSNAAKLFGSKELGTLEAGTVADVTVIKDIEKHHVFTDKYGNTIETENILMPVATVIGGEVLHQSAETV